MESASGLFRSEYPKAWTKAGPNMAAQLSWSTPAGVVFLEAGPLLPIPSCLPQTPLHFLLPIFSWPILVTLCSGSTYPCPGI